MKGVSSSYLGVNFSQRAHLVQWQDSVCSVLGTELWPGCLGQRDIEVIREFREVIGVGCQGEEDSIGSCHSQ